MTSFTVIDNPARPKRGRPRSRLMLPHERPRRVALPFAVDTRSTPTPEYQRAVRHLLEWLATAETCPRPDDRREALEEGFKVLHSAGLEVRDLLEALR